MRESNILHAIMKAVAHREPKAYVRKLADRHTRGLPDLLIIVPTIYGPIQFFVETKTRDGRLSPIQVAEHEKIEQAGGTVIVARDVQTVLDALEVMT